MSAADGAADNGVSCYNNYSYLRFIHKRYSPFLFEYSLRVGRDSCKKLLTPTEN